MELYRFTDKPYIYDLMYNLRGECQFSMHFEGVCDNGYICSTALMLSPVDMKHSRAQCVFHSFTGFFVISLDFRTTCCLFTFKLIYNTFIQHNNNFKFQYESQILDLIGNCLKGTRISGLYIYDKFRKGASFFVISGNIRLQKQQTSRNQTKT